MHHSAGHPKHSFYITILPGTCCKCFLEFQSTFCRPTVDYFLLCHGCVCVSPLHGWLSFDKSCEIHDHGVPSNWVRRNMDQKPFCKWEFSVGNPFVSWVDRTPGRALGTGQPAWLMEGNKTSNQGFTQAHLAKVPSNHHPLVGHFLVVSRLQITSGPLLLLPLLLFVLPSQVETSRENLMICCLCCWLVEMPNCLCLELVVVPLSFEMTMWKQKLKSST